MAKNLVLRSSLTFTEFIVKPKGDFSRLGHWGTAVKGNGFLIGRPGFSTVLITRSLNCYERELHGVRDLATSTYLNGCDIVTSCNSPRLPVTYPELDRRS